MGLFLHYGAIHFHPLTSEKSLPPRTVAGPVLRHTSSKELYHDRWVSLAQFGPKQLLSLISGTLSLLRMFEAIDIIFSVLRHSTQYPIYNWASNNCSYRDEVCVTCQGAVLDIFRFLLSVRYKIWEGRSF